jgi:hypothetical protein
MEKETWKTVADTNGLYEVSCMGRIRRTAKMRSDRWDSRGELVYGSLCEGYMRIVLCVNGDRKHCRVHRLVAMAFLGICPDGMQVNHKDLDKSNNKVSNLEYVTPLDNVHHAIRGGVRWVPRGSQCRRAILDETDVTQIRNAHAGADRKYGMYQLLAEMYGVSPRTIKAVVLRQNWKHVSNAKV